MVLREYVALRWRRFLDALCADDRQRLLEFLLGRYADEARDADQLEAHARRMIYPQYRDRLLHIAQEEKKHVNWLRDKIRALGGEPPELQSPLRNGVNPWQNLLMDIDEEKRDAFPVGGNIYAAAEQVDPEIAAGLRWIHDDEVRHRDEIREMLMRSDPQAFSVTPLGEVAAANK